MSWEFAAAPRHLRIDHPLNVSDPYDETDGFQRRALQIAKQYLAGRPIFIQTAALRGPFDNSWQNPWLSSRKAVKRRKLAETQSKSDFLSSKPSKKLQANDGTAAPYSEQARDDALPQHDTRKRSDEGHQVHGHRNQNARRKQKDLSKSSIRNDADHPVSPATSTSSRPSSPSRPQSKGRIPHNLIQGLSEEDILPKRKRRRAQDQRSSASVNLRNARKISSQGSVLATTDPKVLKSKARNEAKKRHATNRQCLWCGVDESSQWRKGPLGPKTLCSSCGAKWTHQVRKQKQQQQRRMENINASPDKPSNMPQTRITQSKPIQSDTSNRLSSNAAKTPTHSQICRALFPYSQIRNAIMANKGTELEHLLDPEVLNLRGYSSPLMKTWNRSRTQQVTAMTPMDEVMKPRNTASPVKARGAVQSLQGDDTDSSGYRPRKEKKRKMTTFDTPRDNRRNPSRAVSSYPDITTNEQQKSEDSQEKSEEWNMTLNPHPLVEPTKSSETRTSNDLGAERALILKQSEEARRGNCLTPRREKISSEHPDEPKSLSEGPKTVTNQATQYSTQGALLRAAEAFQGHLRSSSPMQHEVTTSSRTPPRSLSDSNASPQSTGNRMVFSFPTDTPIKTQDLFNQTLEFGSVSPWKDSGKRSKHTLAPQPGQLFGQGTPRSIFGRDVEDLPTSPATSQPEFEIGHEGGVSERPSTASTNPVNDRPTGAQTPDNTGPLFSSTTKLLSRSSRANDERLADGSVDPSLTVDVDAVMREAGSFLNTWRTEM